MTNLEINKLEERLGVKIPACYRSFLLCPPFDETSIGYDFLELGNIDVLILNNIWFREQGHPFLRSRPVSDFLYVGSNDSDLWYIMDLTDELHPVIAIDLNGDADSVETYSSFASFVIYMQGMTASKDEDNVSSICQPMATSARYDLPIIIGIFILIIFLVILFNFGFFLH